MGIDGRSLVPGGTAKKDAYESLGVRLLAQAFVWVPLALVALFIYWSGTWIGGWVGGLASLLSSAAVFGGFYLVRQRRQARRSRY